MNDSSKVLSSAAPDGVACSVEALLVHPVKSCGGIAVREALLVDTGLEFDRTWMVVDDHGEMLTQRQLPRMALIQPAMRHGAMVLRAPGMLALHVTLHAALHRVAAPTRVRVWHDIVKADDMGDLAAQWCSTFLGQPLRLVRFDPDERRLSDPAWTGDVAAHSAFADGFPLLVASTASLADLNGRLAARGAAPVTMQRFRPNIVLDGLEAFDEDHIDTLIISADDGPVTLRLVKPCVRCSIPNVDPATAATGHEPGDTLAGFRADPRMHGGLTFAMNAVVVDGFERTMRVGQRAVAQWRFD